MKNNNSAFSLIELSIVILIIGILVLGITKGARIMSNAKLTSARALTKNSPVNLNADKLAIWIETTSEKSFTASEVVNNGSITIWNDINPSLTSSTFNVTPTGTAPKYIAKATNGLPALRFTNTPMIKSNVPGSALTQDGKQITIFLVQKYSDYPNIASPFFWQSGSMRIGTHSFNGDILFFDMGLCCNSDGRIAFNPAGNYRDRTIIITYIRKPNNVGLVKINGQNAMTPQTGMNNYVNTSLISDFEIGPDLLNSDLNELIIFKTALKDSEITEIEQYLSNKWSVKLNGL